MRAVSIIVLAATGCVETVPLTMTPQAPEGQFAMGVAGWGSENPRLWSDDEGFVFTVDNHTALHWLHVPFDPTELLFKPGLPAELIDNREEVASKRGLEIPVVQAYRLSDDPEESWTVDYDFKKRDALFLGDQKDPAVCAAIQGCVVDGVCKSTCEVPDVTPPVLPQIECPPTWTDIGVDGEMFCFPIAWQDAGEISAPSPQRDCSAGQVDRGEGCEVLSPCTSERFRPVDDDLSSAVFVDASAAPGGDGSLAAPYQTIDDALSTNRSPIMLASGEYVPATPSMNGRDIVGACPATTLISLGLTLSEGQLRLRGVTVTGRAAIHQTGGMLGLEDTVLRGSEWGLVQQGGTATATTVLFHLTLGAERSNPGAALDSAVQAEFRGNDSHFVGGARIRDASGTLINSSVNRREDDAGFVVDIRQESEAAFTNVEVVGGIGLTVFVGEASSLSATQLRIVSERTIGLAVSGTSAADLDEVVVLLRQPHREVPRPTGVSIENSQLRLRNFATANFSKGLVVYGGDPRLQGEPPHIAELHVDRAWIRFDHATGILGRHNVSAVSLTDVFISGSKVEDPLFMRAVPDSIDNAVVSFRSGTVDVTRLWARPEGRHAIFGGSFVLLSLDDLFVDGVHGYTFYLRDGVRAVVNRATALGGSGGMYMQRYLQTTPLHNLPREAFIYDLNLAIDEAETERLGFQALPGGGVPTSIERFIITGRVSVERDVLAGTYRLKQGILTYPPGEEWPENFIEAFDEVRLR